MRAARLRWATQTAERFVQAQGLPGLPVDPFQLAARLDIVVQPKPATLGGVSGMLLWHGTTFGILYATHIDHEGFQRFSVGHELGHYLLEGHLAASSTPVALACTGTSWVYEREADYFAAGLLMPEPWFSQAAQTFPPGLAAVKGLAEVCRTSLLATARRYLATRPAPRAVVVSTGPTIAYSFLSPALADLVGEHRLRPGQPLPPTSATAQFNRNPQLVTLAQAVTAFGPMGVWFGGLPGLEGVEEVIGLGRYGKTLTLLSVAARTADRAVAGGPTLDSVPSDGARG